MSGSDRWFRWSFNLFIFLMCFQLGMLLFLKNMFYMAEQEMKRNQVQVAFACGDFQKEDSYFPIPESRYLGTENCGDLFCPDSLWVTPRQQEQEGELHIVSVERPQPSRVENGELHRGYFVDVQLRPSEKPMTLVLVSQEMMQWNFKIKGEKTKKPQAESLVEGPDAHLPLALLPWSLPKQKEVVQGIKEVIVLAPELVWLEGLPEGVPVHYFNKEQICNFPIAWEDIKNPENQYRRLLMALREYTGLELTSFQGKKVGRKLSVPFKNLLAQERAETRAGRGLASEQPTSNDGLNWQRQGHSLQATSFKYHVKGEQKSIEVPKRARDAFFEVATGQVYMINKHRFGTWDLQSKKFQVIHLPMRLPALYWPTAMTFNPLKSEIYIYNDDRGGEIYSYNVVNQKWRVLAKDVGYSLVSLLYDREKEVLYGTRYRGKKITQLVEIKADGQKLTNTDLAAPIDFAKNRWSAKLVQGGSEIWLKVSHPASPQGDLYPLSQSANKL